MREPEKKDHGAGIKAIPNREQLDGAAHVTGYCEAGTTRTLSTPIFPNVAEGNENIKIGCFANPPHSGEFNSYDTTKTWQKCAALAWISVSSEKTAEFCNAQTITLTI